VTGRRVGLRRSIAHVAEAASLAVVMGIFACLPVDRASSLGGYFGRSVGPRLRLSRRAMRNIAGAFPANDDAKNRQILVGMWDNLGRTLAEYPHLTRICAAGSARVEIVNANGVAHLLEDGHPGLVFGGHFCNWEVGPSTIHRMMGTSLLSIYREPNNPWFDRLMTFLRPPRAAVSKGAAGGRGVLQHLRRDGHVPMLVDQKMNDGIAVPFFGRDAMTAPALARLGLRFHCPIVPIRTERLDGARFRFTVLPPLEMADTGDQEADVLATMTRVNATIESWVRARPEQWLWLHRRWPAA
jgi:Kdo2-lipid IVA lauroyltransferase/acyltransferase